MIDSVAGAITAPIPSPCTDRTTTSSQTGESRSSSWIPTNEAVIRANPLAQTALAPNRSASRELRGAMIAMPRATGISAAPLCSGS
jgi:hypothetical protein